MKKIVCPECGKTLCYAAKMSEIEIKCTRKKCGKVLRIKINGDESIKHTVIRE